MLWGAIGLEDELRQTYKDDSNLWCHFVWILIKANGVYESLLSRENDEGM